MSDGLTALFIIGTGVGGYFLYRHFGKSKESGDWGSHHDHDHDHEHHGKSHVGYVTSGYFAGASIYGVDYLNSMDATSDRRPESRMFLIKPYQIFNPGGGQRPWEMDAQGQATNRPVVLPGESSKGMAPGGYVLVGQGGVKSADPRNCLCPQSLDPLDPRLPEYKCSCSVPGAVKPPYAGFYATGRGSGRRHHHPRHQDQQSTDDS